MDDKLLIKYIKGDASEREKESITEWLEKDSENMRHFMSLRKLFDISLWNVSPQKQSNKSISIRKVMYELLKVAAIFIIAIFIVRELYVSHQKEYENFQSVYAPAGQHVKLTLSDGSVVWLNANSTLYFPSKFSDKKRVVKLEGEGFFDVKANAQRPFIVSTNNYDIKAVGTSFNVLAYTKSADSFETALLKGKVEVTDKANSKTIQLRQDYKVSNLKGSLNVSNIQNKDYFLWRDGIISFDDEPIMNIINKLELYFDVKIIVNDSSIKENQYRYTGKFRTRDGLEHVLKVLQVNKPFKYYKDDDNNIIRIEKDK